MKIAYLIDYDLNETSGVVQKIKQNIVPWVQSGHTVYFVSTKTMSIYDSDANIIIQEKSLNIKLGRLGTALKLLYNSFYIQKLLEHVDFDLIYMRYRLYMPFFNKSIKNHTVIMEINGDDTIEYKLKSLLTHYYNKYTRDFLLKYIDGFIAVSDELKERFEYLHKPIEVIANGIDLKEYSVWKTPNNKIPTFVFIATPNQPWQGLDKILEMAKYFLNYQFYIIGTSGNDSTNVKYFGYLSQKDSTKIIERCDIGIGTLALYKQGLNEASPLKTRQYLACGLPIIYAYKDTDLPDNTEFGLKFENKEKNLDYQKIEEFTNFVFANNSVIIKAREFAEIVLDYTKKEEIRIKFFKTFLNK